MSADAHHRAALIDTAGLELDRAHQAALAMQAGDMRRGLQLALDALREAAAIPLEDAEPTPGAQPLAEWIAELQLALNHLDGGSLSEMESLIEDVRRKIVR
jgi:hypothetical protein